MLFPKIVVEILIYAALVMTSLAGVALLAILWNDFKNKRIW